MDCKAMLEAVFAHAKNNPPGDFPSQGTVFVTVTIHQSLDDSFAKTRDVVYYANGPLQLRDIPFKGKYLEGDIQAFVNWVALVELKPKPGSISLGKEEDHFPVIPGFKLRVSINASGFVSAQFLANGIPFAGPAVTFQSVCTDGLLTFVTNKTSYTLSFTLRQKPL